MKLDQQQTLGFDTTCWAEISTLLGSMLASLSYFSNNYLETGKALIR